VGSGRAERLDPFALPLRFVDADFAADGQVRHVELHRVHVVLRRALSGIKMAVNLPVAAEWRGSMRASARSLRGIEERLKHERGKQDQPGIAV
jgi:hypothetical protein